VKKLLFLLALAAAAHVVYHQFFARPAPVGEWEL
jgi:hypothetical protein